jgi:Do/DeqQ family serine protease
MKFLSNTKKVIYLALFGMTVGIASPYILGKLNFYGVSHATDIRPTAVTQSSTISSTCLNAPVSYADAVALAAPAVVSIKTTKEIPMELNPLFQDPFFRYFFGDPNANGGGEWGGNRERGDGRNEPPKEILQGLGSGVVVHEKGYILTNNHVIKEVDTMVVTLADGRTANATVVGTDPDTDLAVLQIKLDKLPVITLGSSQKLRAGDVVLAIGNPFGLDKTVTQGIVSATERTGADIGILENLIQTDAAMNAGNSGGALIDSFGRLVGINTAIYSRSGGNQGVGFAIPIDQASEVMNKLIEGKRIIRGFLGIIMQSLNKEMRDYLNYKDPDGVYVRAVVHGSPAQKAGLLPGDIVTKINNITIKDDRMALRIVAGLTPGKSYPLEIFRKGDHMTFTIMPAERKQSAPPTNKRKETE